MSEELTNSNQRMWDLVRYMRSDLLTAGLISEDEYAELAKDHAAVQRLEDYDAALAGKLAERPAGMTVDGWGLPADGAPWAMANSLSQPLLPDGYLEARIVTTQRSNEDDEETVAYFLGPNRDKNAEAIIALVNRAERPQLSEERPQLTGQALRHLAYVTCGLAPAWMEFRWPKLADAINDLLTQRAESPVVPLRRCTHKKQIDKRKDYWVQCVRPEGHEGEHRDDAIRWESAPAAEGAPELPPGDTFTPEVIAALAEPAGDVQMNDAVKRAYNAGLMTTSVEQAKEYLRAVREAEQAAFEKAAQVCDQHVNYSWAEPNPIRDTAAAIRSLAAGRKEGGK